MPSTSFPCLRKPSPAMMTSSLWLGFGFGGKHDDEPFPLFRTRMVGWGQNSYSLMVPPCAQGCEQWLQSPSCFCLEDGNKFIKMKRLKHCSTYIKTPSFYFPTKREKKKYRDPFLEHLAKLSEF